jgi:hypothetical protein
MLHLDLEPRIALGMWYCERRKENLLFWFYLSDDSEILESAIVQYQYIFRYIIPSNFWSLKNIFLLFSFFVTCTETDRPRACLPAGEKIPPRGGLVWTLWSQSFDEKPPDPRVPCIWGCIGVDMIKPESPEQPFSPRTDPTPGRTPIPETFETAERDYCGRETTYGAKNKKRRIWTFCINLTLQISFQVGWKHALLAFLQRRPDHRFLDCRIESGEPDIQSLFVCSKRYFKNDEDDI